MKKSDLIWAAGFLEGEGSFAIEVNRPRAGAFVIASQANKDPIVRLHNLFAGHFRFDNYRENHSTKPRWVWRQGINFCHAWLPEIIPYITPGNKQDQAILVYDFAMSLEESYALFGKRIPAYEWERRVRAKENLIRIRNFAKGTYALSR